jgi:ribose-phosphate pyrophosphokinase
MMRAVPTRARPAPGATARLASGGVRASSQVASRGGARACSAARPPLAPAPGRGARRPTVALRAPAEGTAAAQRRSRGAFARTAADAATRARRASGPRGAITDRSSDASAAAADAEIASSTIDLEDVAIAGAAMSSAVAEPVAPSAASAADAAARTPAPAPSSGRGALKSSSSSSGARRKGGLAVTGAPSRLLACDRDAIDRDVRSMALPRLQRLDKDSKYPVLFYAPEMKDLAEKIAAEDVGGSSVELGDVDWRKFADGFPDLFVNDAYGVRDRHVAFLASFHSPEVIFEQLSVIYSLPKMFVASFTLVLPFFPTGTSERVEREGEVATAVTLARILSNVPPSRGGPCSTLIFDIHALQERFYFGDNILPCFESGIPLLLNRLANCEDADNIVIAYPDEGAWKRFHGFFRGMEEVVCTKVRDGDKRKVRLKEGEPAGRHVVIVDDLVQSGGTLIECQKLLSRLGAAKVSAYVTHGVFPGESWKKFTASSGAGGQGFTKFFLTDSCAQTAEAVEGVEPFEILSLSRPIAEALHV